MNLAKLNSEVTHGNFQLEKFLRDMVLAQSPSFIPGNIYVVFNTSDEAYVQYAKDWDNLYPDGTRVVQTSLLAAYNATTSNRHDVILINGHNTHTLTAMLTVSKNRIHFMGMDAVGRRYGQGAKVSLGVTTAATDIATILVTGVRNSFHHIKFLNSNTVTEGIYCFADGGEYTFMENCEIYKSTDLDQTGAAELVANGDSSHYKNCYIGTTVDAISGAVIRPCVTFSRGLAAASAVARDVTFENCIFARNFGNSANRFVYGAEANALERLGLFENCIFWGAALSSAVPAQNVAFGATQTDGSVLLHNCSSVAAGTAMSTTTGVFVDSPVPTAATSGISVQAS
jgi:hypothetical protein